MHAISANGTAIKSQIHADMMHDALRSDVLAALPASVKGNVEQVGLAKKDADEHIA